MLSPRLQPARLAQDQLAQRLRCLPVVQLSERLRLALAGRERLQVDERFEQALEFFGLVRANDDVRDEAGEICSSLDGMEEALEAGLVEDDDSVAEEQVLAARGL